MALTLAHRPPLRRAGPALLWAVAGFGAATIGFGLSRNPYLSFALLAMTGALDKISVVVRSTLVQILTPESMRGRVAAVNSIFIGSSNELGGFESGMTARFFGPVASVVGGGIGTILVVLSVRLGWPGVAPAGVAPGPGLASRPSRPTRGRAVPGHGDGRPRRAEVVLDDRAAFHHESDLLQDPDVGQRVGLDRDQVGVEARGDPADLSDRPSSSAASEVAERIARAGVRPYLTM